MQSVYPCSSRALHRRRALASPWSCRPRRALLCRAADPSHAHGHVVPSPGALAAAPPPALAVSRRIAAARAAETLRASSFPAPESASSEESGPLFQDPYAALLAAWPLPPPANPAAAPPSAAASAQAPAQSQSQQPGPGHGIPSRDEAEDVIATAHIDRLLLAATSMAAVNRITQGDYRQVVLVGDAYDTRPYRLPWPPGTALYLAAPAEAHAAAEAALASAEAAAIAVSLLAPPPAAPAAPSASEAAGAGPAAAAAAAGDGPSTSGRGAAAAAVGAKAGAKAGTGRARVRVGPQPPPGCLVRRVPVELKGDGPYALADALARAGFRADRLSVWALQGLAGAEGVGEQEVSALLASAASAAAFHSLLVGELPPLGGRRWAENVVAESGLLGAPLPFGTPDTSYGRWSRERWGPAAPPAGPSADPQAQAQAQAQGQGAGSGACDDLELQRWLFAAQQIRLSDAQADTLAAHSSAAEEADEDFFGNFS
ncbi:hypothetical protein HYH03_016371 [Edaphochlamys debaryana]|uniref:S-adenosyl-L-methionine-dependent methyltransferase n=1 Tax=Edaphochlamys debaryana TaxID=47281 RepID=A0A835XK63_9CHLO|nr:hypothetical protein HYH03_016371 [Edaphochlamys debaryana]|eukprot:KAG2484890.1 hypothetical protein HYH03_016371 [Edaphochlamys debaryana]